MDSGELANKVRVTLLSHLIQRAVADWVYSSRGIKRLNVPLFDRFFLSQFAVILTRSAGRIKEKPSSIYSSSY